MVTEYCHILFSFNPFNNLPHEVGRLDIISFFRKKTET